MKPVSPSSHPEHLVHVRKISRVMDDLVTVPGTRFRIGLDGILGLIPGVGDVAGLAISAYFIFVAAQMRVPAVVLARMFLHVGIDTLVSAIPVLGDLFDFVWKANRKNLLLLEQHAVNPIQTRTRSLWLLVAVACLGVALLIFIVWLVWSLVAALWSTLLH
ncbi:MAG: DUF4112 domain-containing protein [Bdellovibrionaceae bacterium]|nr:DUF4112 domain-containing protein [Pseudobdellovibrionaceae bacterium]